MPHVIRPIFGLEFEVSFSALDSNAQRLSPGMILNEFMALAASRLRHVPAHGSSGIFLENGARLYLDCGKPEITTPEVVTPWDACRYARAGEEILLDISRQLIAENSMVDEVILSRNNVSYGASSNAWACHESYGHRIEDRMAEHFIPHAVSRIIYTGAGGFDNRSHGLKFMISPRVTHLRSAVSENTQRNRGIFNTKEEPLCGNGFRRLHVICGENVSSIVSQWMKMGITAIVVAMIEAGLRPGDGLALRDPVLAMRAIADDPTLTARVTTKRGEQLTAVEMQRRLLHEAGRLEPQGEFASWFEPCCRIWKDMLDRLERGPHAVERSLDWAIKWDLFRRYVERRGLSFERLGKWNQILTRLDEDPDSVGDLQEYFRHLRTSNRQITRQVRGGKKQARELGLDWDELEVVLAVRQELFELDARFGEIGNRGIFNSLDQAGHLDHHAPGVDDIPRARTQPPSIGRAHLRGKVIQRFAGQEGSIGCDWRGMWDFQEDRFLDLSDPFAEEETWKPLTKASPSNDEDYALRISRTLRQARSLYASGDYDSSHRMLSVACEWIQILQLPNLAVVRDVYRYTAWARTRRGYAGGADTLGLLRAEPLDLAAISDYLIVYRFTGIVPPPEFEVFCDRGRRLIADQPARRPVDEALVLAAYAFHLLCTGQPEEAWNAYHDALRPPRRESLHHRSYARILTEQADTLRQLGRSDEAESLLDDAQRIQAAGHSDGDIIDFTLTQRAKLAIERRDWTTAQTILEDVLRAQRGVVNMMGEARSLLLLARISHRHRGASQTRTVAEFHDRLKEICDNRPLLAQCRLTTEILDNWISWVGGEPMHDESDFLCHI